MKAKRIIAAILILVISVFALASCNMLHEHKWQYHLVNIPTCSEKGIIKCLCLECGEMDYEELVESGHDFKNGICTICGSDMDEEKKLEKLPIPAGQSLSGSWSLREIHNTMASLGANDSYDVFVAGLQINDITLKNARIDAFGLFSMTAHVEARDGRYAETPVSIPVERVDFDNPGRSVGNILRADIISGEMVITYRDGTELFCGNIASNGYSVIEGFGINEEGEMFLLYSNGLAAFVGTL